MAGGNSTIPKTGVWWDLNTCPVPTEIDPGHVRWRIESALRKLDDCRPCELTIFAVGNLQYVSPQHLEAISSSEILIRHTVLRGLTVNWLLEEWAEHNPPPAKILLISGDTTWFNPFIQEKGYTILRALPDTLKSIPNRYPSTQLWQWKTLLNENLGNVEKSMLTVKEAGPYWLCDQCQFSCGNCKDFIKHCKSEKHRKQLLRFVSTYDKDDNFLLCHLCQYPGYDQFNMDIHYNSDEHKQNMRKSRLPGEELVNEVNKKK